MVVANIISIIISIKNNTTHSINNGDHGYDDINNKNNTNHNNTNHNNNKNTDDGGDDAHNNNGTNSQS